ncbi:hypothetical protein O7626_40370 [Micromonospora sp. WMMD1102]|uniref:hypothetical protein n=1 Tax=Micromonospora sp. WMMD1102 TaxID=3016105 RepID=UPI002414DBD6|nr:hypothetical protein [Micromonospora sp. WMMD1102]MDG4792074.1 hypothetical protein [Micromonospora sp. WMMD1102]
MGERPVTEQRIRYFVTYVYATRDGLGYGWSDMTCPPIRAGDDISAITKTIRDENHPGYSVTITGWRRFED